MCGSARNDGGKCGEDGAIESSERAAKLAKRQVEILERLNKLTVYIEQALESQVDPFVSLRLRQEAILECLDAIFEQVVDCLAVRDTEKGTKCSEDDVNVRSTVGENGVERGGEAGPSETQQKLEVLCRGLGCQSVLFKRVPVDYYDLSLEARRDILGAHSIEHLCKSIVMVNTQAAADVVNCRDPNNSKFYVVIVQYAARLNAEKLRNFVYGLNEGRIPKKRFNMRLAPEEVSDELTGYTHNSVTPFGMRSQIPVILSHRIMELVPPLFWLGAGEVDLKLGMKCSEFVDALKPFIVDCTY